MAATYFQIQGAAPSPVSAPPKEPAETPEAGHGVLGFSEREQMSPKEFILEKEPKTDVERAACLAFYLTHYRDTPHFKTLDISKLNTEAAQRKFANAAYTLSNAARRGLVVTATRGQKQLSAIGEQFVQALPNRDAAKQVLARLSKPRRSRKPSRTRTRRSRKQAPDKET